MDENIIAFVSSVLVSLIGAISAIYVAKLKAGKSARKEMNTHARDILSKAQKAFKKISGVDKEIENKISLSDKSPPLLTQNIDMTENIDRGWIENLIQFVEEYRIKVDILELFSVDIPAEFFYNFAVYYAFVKKDWITGSYFIDKTLKASKKQKDEDKIDYLRWAARINRLNRNESQAANILTEMINIMSKPDFQRTETYNDFYKARLYRSRGFCYFNMNDNQAAIQDFNRAIRLADKHNDIKIAYCYCGLAMAVYREHKKNLLEEKSAEIIGYYEEAIKREPYFYGEDVKKLWQNLECLESEKKYYFSELEKEALEDIHGLYQTNKVH